MKSLYRPFILLILLCLYHGHTKALTLGAEITWEHVSGNKYRINFIHYADCVGIPVSSATIKVTNISNNTSTNLIVSGNTSKDITPVCASGCTRCSNSSCNSSTAGFIKNLFSNEIELDKTKSCQWRLSFEKCCYVNVINTGATGEYMYIESWMDLCAAPGYNSSPYFTRDARIIFCKDQCIVYNPGARDDDTINGEADLLTYRMTPALKGYGISATYDKGFDYTYPVTFNGSPDINASWSNGCGGFHMDTATGEMRFKPEKAEYSLLTFAVDEWRKDSNGKLQKIGSITRCLLMSVENCSSNSIPSITTGNGKTAYTICAGVETVIPVSTWDVSTDSVKLHLTDTIPGATFGLVTGKMERGTFKWTPSKNDIRTTPYQFVVTATDNACSIPASTDQTISIKVVGEVKPVHFSVDTIGVRTYKFTPDTTDTTLIYHWDFGNGDTSGSAKPQYIYEKDGDYTVTLTTSYPQGCSASTPLEVPVHYCIQNIAPALQLPNKGKDVYYICADDSFCLPVLATDKNSTRDSVFIGWDKKIKGATLTGNKDLGMGTALFCWKPSSSDVGADPYEFNLFAMDNYEACPLKDEVSMKLYVTPPVNANFTATPYFSKEMAYNFQPQDLSFDFYEWTFGDGNTSIGIKPSHTYAADGVYTVRLKITSSSGCSKITEQTLVVRSCAGNKSPVISAVNNKYSYTVCAGDSFCIDMLAKDADTMDKVSISWDNGVKGGSFISNENKASFCWKPLVKDINAVAYQFRVIANDNFSQCAATDTATFSINVAAAPDAGFSISCSGLGCTFTPADTGMKTYLWEFGDGYSSANKSPTHFYAREDSFLVKLTVENGAGCNAVYSVNHSLMTTSIEETNQESYEWKIYPNPVKGERLIIESPHPLTSPVTISLYDMKGGKVLQASSSEIKTELKLLARLLPGTYILKIEGAETFRHEILIK